FDAAGHGVLTDSAMLFTAHPAEPERTEVAASGRLAELGGITVSVRLAEGVAARRQRHGLLMVHRHPLEGRLDVTRRFQWVRVSARPFRIDVDQAHLDRRERAVEVLEPAILIYARLNALVYPLV